MLHSPKLKLSPTKPHMSIRDLKNMHFIALNMMVFGQWCQAIWLKKDVCMNMKLSVSECTWDGYNQHVVTEDFIQRLNILMGNKLSCNCGPLSRKPYRYEDTPWSTGEEVIEALVKEMDTFYVFGLRFSTLPLLAVVRLNGNKCRKTLFLSILRVSRYLIYLIIKLNR